MSGINKVILVGNLGRDPEVRTFENGVKKASFTLATSETYKDKNGNRTEVTEWHNIYCWRNLAEVAEKYLTKGKMIYLEGKLRTRNWEENGTRRYITEIEASTFTILSPKGAGDTPAEQQVPNNTLETPSDEPYGQSMADGTDGLPF